jgi:hypothetical protein
MGYSSCNVQTHWTSIWRPASSTGGPSYFRICQCPNALPQTGGSKAGQRMPDLAKTKPFGLRRIPNFKTLIFGHTALMMTLLG